MKKKIRFAVQVLLSFLIGSTLGVLITMRVYTRYLMENVYFCRPSLEVINAIGVLEHLHHNQEDSAKELLEWQLDEGLVGLTTYGNDKRNLAELNPIVVNSIIRAKRYRQHHPHRLVEEELEKDLNHLFSLVP